MRSTRFKFTPTLHSIPLQKWMWYYYSWYTSWVSLYLLKLPPILFDGLCPDDFKQLSSTLKMVNKNIALEAMHCGVYTTSPLRFTILCSPKIDKYSTYILTFTSLDSSDAIVNHHLQFLTAVFQIIHNLKTTILNFCRLGVKDRNLFLEIK